ncbi:MAG: ATP-binding protein [Bryobacteraceae bacterium]
MLRLLVVEDEAVGGDIVRWFGSKGWRADWAKDSKNAKVQLEASLRENTAIDAILLDRKMGLAGDAGDKLLRWTRDRREFDYACVVMLTGYGSTSNAAECMRLGADHYLEKRVPFEDLRDVLVSGILTRRARELRHAAVFGNATPEQSQKAIHRLMRAVTGDDEISVHLSGTDASIRTVNADPDEVPSVGARPFIRAVLDSKRPFAALTATEARKAGALRTDAQSLIAVPIPSDTTQPIGVWAVESSLVGVLKRHLVDPMEEFGQVIAVATALAEKRALLEERASNALLALNEIRHKLSTPVQAIEWKIEELRDQEPAPGIRKPLAVIARNISTIRNLCYQLNDEASEIPIDKKEFDLRALLRDYVGEFRSEAQSKEIDLACEDLPKRPLKVKADKRWIGYSLQCLLRNAIEAIEAQRLGSSKSRPHGAFPTRGRIVVRLAEPKNRSGQVSISVEDTGTGIGEKDRERVFQPLFSTKSQRPRGLGGLGLYSVQRILIQHGGSANFNSTPGKGATFRLTFPIK